MSFSPTTPLPAPKYNKRNSFENSASPLFSPSAAARYALQAEKWNQVDKWLARVFFPNRVPHFDRDDETLAYLHALSATSTQRTKEKNALSAAQEAAAREYEEQAREIRGRLDGLGIRSDELDGETSAALDELVDIAEEVNVDPVGVDVMAIANALSEKIDDEFEVEQRLREMKALHASLKREVESMRKLEGGLERVQLDHAAKEDVIDERFSEWTRGIKLLKAKTEEYQSRTPKNLEIPDDIRISRLVGGEEGIKELKKRVAKAQSEVDNYAMLPYDEKGARKELQKLKAELERLRRKRDTLWEQVTE